MSLGHRPLAHIYLRHNVGVSRIDRYLKQEPVDGWGVRDTVEVRVTPMTNDHQQTLDQRGDEPQAPPHKPLPTRPLSDYGDGSLIQSIVISSHF